MALQIQGDQEYLSGKVAKITTKDRPDGATLYFFQVIREGQTIPDDTDYSVFVGEGDKMAPWPAVKVGDHREFAYVTKGDYKNLKATELLEAATAESVAHVEVIAAQPRPMSAAKMTEQRSISRSVALKAAVDWAVASVAVAPDNYQTIGVEITNMAEHFAEWLMLPDIDDILNREEN